MFFRIIFALKNGSRVHKYPIREDPTHFTYKGKGKHGIQVASYRFIIGVTKSRLNSSVEANIEPGSILFHKLEFIKIRE